MLPIILSDRLRGELEALLAPTPSAKQWCRARALLWLADGRPVAEVADLLLVSRQSVSNRADRFEQREDFELRARLLDAPRSGRPPTASGVIDPLIAEVIDKDPREMGYRSTNWTAGPLVRYLKRAHGIEVSRGSVGLAIDRPGIRWNRPRHELALRPETWRQSKGG
ncbi:MAG: helix-turn-helix domain-containing protein [Bradyrhizobium sp.]|nr:helix-turn-helix domain-containing protein [Bradyrhizobium sp.]